VTIDHDYRVSFKVLRTYADRLFFLVPLYHLACKIADAHDADVTSSELKMARGCREPGTEPGPVQEFSSLLTVYQPITVGPRLLIGHDERLGKEGQSCWSCLLKTAM
jgi:hypothetical protein